MKTATDQQSVGEPMRGLRIRARVFLATAALVALAVGTAISAGTWRANAVAERSIRDALDHVPQVFAAFRGNIERLARDQLRSIADEPGTKSIFAAADGPTRWEFARDTARLHRAQTVFLFGRDSKVLARSDKPPNEGIGQPFAGVRWVADVLDAQRETSAAIREGDTLSVVAAVPVFSGEGAGQTLLGVLAASFPLDAARAAEIQQLTRGEVGFLRNAAKRDQAPQLQLAAGTVGLTPDALVPALNLRTDVLAELFESPEPMAVGPLDFEFDGDARLLVALPIRSAAGETLGVLAVSRSRAAEVAAFGEIRDTLLVVGVLALIVAIPLSFMIGRGIARPIEQLAAGAQAIRDGRLDVELPTGSGGEIGALADAFGQRVAELKEKAALERLVGDLQRVAEVSDDKSVAALPAVDTSSAAADPAAPLPGGLYAGRFRIQGPPEARVRGPVYRAVDGADEVDLQIVDSEYVADAAAVRALEVEVALARRVSHPNVIAVRDCGQRDGAFFIVAEHANGVSLRRLIERLGGGLALQPGLQMAKQLLRGLAAIHSVGACHRNVCPQNVIVLPNGMVKLAQVILPATNDRAESRYRSPEEQAGGDGSVSGDLYSMGALMFETFTGVAPVGEPGSLLEDALPSSVRSGLPASLDRIILACLARKSESRPRSADAVYSALMRITG